MSGKQSKILNSSQQKTVLNFLETTRYPLRNKLIFLLSFKSGLRSKEISEITWSSVCDPEGNLTSEIVLYDNQSKGRSGRTIPMSKSIYDVLILYKNDIEKSHEIQMDNKIILSERGNRMSSQSIVNIFREWYQKLGLHGCSSHSGRRTFITQASRKISLVSGSLRNVQILAGHTNLGTTQRYIEYDNESSRKLIDLL